jgi:hypothetical protein
MPKHTRALSLSVSARPYSDLWRGAIMIRGKAMNEDADTDLQSYSYVLSDDEAVSLGDRALSIAVDHVRRLGRPWEDVHDVKHEVLVALLSRLHKFNEKRGNIYQFASRIFKNRISELGHEYYQCGLLELPLSDCLVREPVAADDHGGTDLRMDMEPGLGILRPGDADVIEALLEDDPVAAAEVHNIPLSKFYRTRREIRRRLRMVGLAAGGTANGYSSRQH